MAGFIQKKSTVPSAVEADELYMCGLLHDIGKIVMLDQMKAEYVEVIQAAQQANIPSWRMEEDRFGFAHTAVGGVLGSHWNLPDVVVDAITRHHDELEAILDQPVTIVVACADQVVRCVEDELWPAAHAVFDGKVREMLGLSDAAVGEIVEFTKELEVEL